MYSIYGHLLRILEELLACLGRLATFVAGLVPTS